MLGLIDPHETFGEISFLQGEGATVSVIADDDSVRCAAVGVGVVRILLCVVSLRVCVLLSDMCPKVEVYVIEGYNIVKQFDARPGFGTLPLFDRASVVLCCVVLFVCLFSRLCLGARTHAARTAARFYKYLATVLNNRIRAREDAASSRS